MVTLRSELYGNSVRVNQNNYECSGVSWTPRPTWELVQLHAFAVHLQNVAGVGPRNALTQCIQRTLEGHVLVGGGGRCCH